MVLESGEDRVKELCEILRNDTIQPAKEEAAKIIREAKEEATHIIARANEDADDIMKNLKRDLEKMQSVSDASIELAIKQGISKLKQLVAEMFNEELFNLADSMMNDTEVLTKVVDALVKALEKDGLGADLQLVLANGVSKDELIGKLALGVRSKLEKGGVKIGEFKSGVVVKVVDKKMAIEMTDKAVVELISSYVSDDLSEKLAKLV